MSGYNIEYFIADFAKRTLCNLEVIEQIKKGHIAPIKKVYEVTQLINSMFGLIVVTYEAIKPYKDKSKVEDTIRAYNSRVSKLKKANIVAYQKLIEFIKDLQKNKRLYNSYGSYEKEIESGDRLLLYFIEHIRNALSHGGDTGLHFYPVVLYENDDKDEIESVIFEDTNPNNESERFIVELYLEEMEFIIHCLNEIIQKRPNIKEAKSNQKKYDKKINELRELLHGKPYKSGKQEPINSLV